MALAFKAGDIVKTNVTYIEDVLHTIKSPSPTVFQTIQSLGLLGNSTAIVQNIGHISIDGDFHTSIHIVPTDRNNVLHRNGKGTKIYFKGEAQANGSLSKAS